jgi:type II secretory pathway component GspD/PulD (secretin)
LPEIVAEERTNSLLIVGATPAQRAVIEQLVEVIDAADTPENALSRRPTLIRLQHASAEQVADVVRDVFRHEMGPAQSGRDGGNGNNFDPRNATMAQFGRGGNRGQSSPTPAERRGPTLSVGVDSTSNTLVVSAPQAIVAQVEELARSLDQAAANQRRSIRVVPVRLSKVSGTQQTLAALFGTGRSADTPRRDRGRDVAEPGGDATAERPVFDPSQFGNFGNIGGPARRDRNGGNQGDFQQRGGSPQQQRGGPPQGRFFFQGGNAGGQPTPPR